MSFMRILAAETPLLAVGRSRLPPFDVKYSQGQGTLLAEKTASHLNNLSV
jgi:hypothetical protein